MFSITKAFSDLRRNWVYRLPKYRCAKWIEIAGSHYNDDYYKVVVELETSKIISWVENQWKVPWVSYNPIQISLELFPTWLKNADFENESVTKLDFYQRRLLKQHISTFIEMGVARIYCSTCEKYYSKVTEVITNKTRVGDKISWTKEVSCPKKHSLSIDDYYILVNERPKVPTMNPIRRNT